MAAEESLCSVCFSSISFHAFDAGHFTAWCAMNATLRSKLTGSEFELFTVRSGHYQANYFSIFLIKRAAWLRAMSGRCSSLVMSLSKGSSCFGSVRPLRFN